METKAVSLRGAKRNCGPVIWICLVLDLGCSLLSYYSILLAAAGGLVPNVLLHVQAIIREQGAHQDHTGFTSLSLIEKES